MVHMGSDGFVAWPVKEFMPVPTHPTDTLKSLFRKAFGCSAAPPMASWASRTATRVSNGTPGTAPVTASSGWWHPRTGPLDTWQSSVDPGVARRRAYGTVA